MFSRTSMCFILFLALISPEAKATFPRSTIHSQNACNAYPGLVKSYGFTNHWRFLETSGTTAADSIGSNTGTYSGTPTLNQAGPLVAPSKSVLLNGTNHIYTATSYNNPTTFTMLAWFKTTTTSGGKIIGFGNSQSGNSAGYDRHIYMTNAGNILFGIYNGAVNVVSTAAAYNDGNWHMAAATFGAAGMALYVDGSAAAINTSVTTTQNINGYWRIGWDNLSGWTSAPTAHAFTGSLAEVAISVGTAMTVDQIRTLYYLGKQCQYYTPPPASLSIATSAQTVIATQCSAVTTAQANDPVASNLTVNITGNNGLTFYSNSTCTSSITSVTIPTGQSTANFYFKGPTAGTATITLAATGYANGTQDETIIANPYIWIGGGGDANWTTGANWSGGAAPGSSTSNVATFDSTCVSNCSPTINANINVGGISMTSGYSGTITQGAGTTITVGANGWVQAAGTFTGGNSSISITGAFALSGGTFSGGTSTNTFNGSFSISGGTYTATSNTTTINSNYSVSGSPTFNHSSGTFSFPFGSVVTHTYGSINHHNVTMGAANWGAAGTLSGELNILGTLNINFAGGCCGGGILSGSGVWAAKGNVNFQHASGIGGTVTLKIAGSGNQTITGVGAGAVWPNITVASTGGTVTYVGAIRADGNYTVTSGAIDATTNSSTLHLASGGNSSIFTFNGETYHNLILGGNFLGGPVTIVGSTTVAGTLTMNYTGSCCSGASNGGTISVTGNVNLSGIGGGWGSTLVKMVGSGNQTITGTTSTNIPNLTIESTGGTVSVSGGLHVSNSLSIAAGNFSVSGANLNIAGNLSVTTPGTFTPPTTLSFTPPWGNSFTIIPGSAAYNNVTFSPSFANYYNLGGNTMTINGTTTVSATNGSSSIDNGTLNMKGNLSYATMGGGTVALTFSGTSTQTVTHSSGTMPSGTVTLNNAAGLTLGSAVTWNGASQTFTVTTGNVGMAGYNFTLRGLTLNGNTLTKGGGTLSVNGSTIGTGSLYGGTVDP